MGRSGGVEVVGGRCRRGGFPVVGVRGLSCGVEIGESASHVVVSLYSVAVDNPSVSGVPGVHEVSKIR